MNFSGIYTQGTCLWPTGVLPRKLSAARLNPARGPPWGNKGTSPRAMQRRQAAKLLRRQPQMGCWSEPMAGKLGLFHPGFAFISRVAALGLSIALL